MRGRPPRAAGGAAAPRSAGASRAHLRAWVRLVLEERLVRSRGSFLGQWWGLALPAAESVVFTALFGAVLLVRGSPLDYLPFAFIGLLSWRVLARAVTGASGSLGRRAPLLRTFPVPVALVPLASVADAFLAGAVGLPAVALVVVLTSGPPPAAEAAVWLPVAALLHLVTAAGLAMLVAVAAAFFRDVRSALPAALGGLMFLSPVVYPSRLVPEGVRTLYLLNPVAAVLDGYRAGLLGDPPPPPASVAGASALALLLLAAGAVLLVRQDGRLREVV